MFFQDKQMKDAFSAYPELIFLDATYKLLQLGLPTYIMLCEDSNGQSEVFAVCLLVTEDASSMTWMMDTFKKCNSDWEKVHVVMADKDIGERDVIKKCLPNVSVLICLFHAMRTFRREVTCDKLGISSGQRNLCLELIQKIAYASSTDEYDNLYSQFQRDVPREVVTYYDTNWHNIRNEWVLGLKFTSGNFLNSTNNRLESIYGKLKQVITKHSTLEDFVSHFFIVLNALRVERDHKAALIFQKVKVSPFPVDSCEYEYSKLLTPYALKFVLKQIQLVERVEDITEEDNEQYTVQTSEGQIDVSLLDCNCMFRTSMSLPCRHMLKLRKKLGEPLYHADICDRRWTIAYYKTTQRLFSSSTIDPAVVTTMSKNHKHKHSQHEKFRKASLLTAELASIASEASGIHYSRRIEVLKDLIEHWKRNDEVVVTEVDGKLPYISSFNSVDSLDIFAINTQSDDSDKETEDEEKENEHSDYKENTCKDGDKNDELTSATTITSL